MEDLDKNETIQSFLRTCKGGASVSEIARRIHFSRATVSKYLEMMHIAGTVSYTMIGKAKVWSIPQTSTTQVLILTQEDNFSKLLGYLLTDKHIQTSNIREPSELFTTISKNKPDVVIVKNSDRAKELTSLLKQMRENAFTREIPVVILTHPLDATTHNQIKEHQQVTIINMPFDTNVLKAQLRLAVEDKEHDVNPISNLPGKTHLVNEHAKEGLSNGILITVEGSQAIRERNAVRFEEFIQLLSQVLKEQTHSMQLTNALGHITIGQFLILVSPQAKDTPEIKQCMNEMLKSFRSMIQYMAAEPERPSIRIQVLESEELNKLLQLPLIKG